jgi:uncharacterized protein YbjQ (UPF0145 family)
MPWFFGKTDEEKQQEAEREAHEERRKARQQASLDSLARGSIPIEAQERLAEVRRQDGKFFTSDLSVKEFLLAKQVGLRPLSQVMGCSVYHVGWQRTISRTTPPGELTVVSGAINEARGKALARMAEEASALGAHVVVGVHMSLGRYEWAEGMIEFNFVGTAMRLEGEPPATSASLTNLSGQDFWKLYQAGFWPVGVVAGSSVYHVIPSWNTRLASGSWFQFSNQELTDFTQGLYAARHNATRYVTTQANALGGGGVVGMTIDSEAEDVEVALGNDQERTDMIFTFHCIGTAIVQLAGTAAIPATTPTVNLR